MSPGWSDADNVQHIVVVGKSHEATVQQWSLCVHAKGFTESQSQTESKDQLIYQIFGGSFPSEWKIMCRGIYEGKNGDIDILPALRARDSD